MTHTPKPITYHVGQEVRLKSTGEKMLIEKVGPESEVRIRANPKSFAVYTSVDAIEPWTEPATFKEGQWVRLKKLVFSAVCGNEQAFYKAGEQVRIFSMCGYWATFNKPGRLSSTCHTSNFEPVDEPSKFTKGQLVRIKHNIPCSDGTMLGGGSEAFVSAITGATITLSSREDLAGPWTCVGEADIEPAIESPAQPQAPAAQPGPAPTMTERQQALFHDKGDPKILPSELRDPTKTIYPTPTFRGMTATQVLDFLNEIKEFVTPHTATPPVDVESVKQYAINLFSAGLVSTFSKAVDAGCIPPDLFPICRNIVVDHAREFLNATTKTK